MRARRRELETDLMRGAANATFEGLLVCEGATIVTVNDNFAAHVDIGLTFFDQPNRFIEGTLVRVDGSKIPVELIQRSIDFGGTPHRAVAVRDLRARKEAEKH